MTKHWALDDIRWDQFDPSRVDPDILKVIKAASVVEFNGTDYGQYLNNVFYDDPLFKSVIIQWAQEEVQHGKALAKWVQLCDPSFDFTSVTTQFTDHFKVDVEAKQSIRGSRAAELLARCMVEVGTSSFYFAVRDATDEPVLKEICNHIATDELKHYKLFYTHLQRYQAAEPIPLWRRLWFIVSRLMENEDDELASAYYATNHGHETYDRSRFAKEYLSRVYRFYDSTHMHRGIAMVLKAIGLKPYTRFHKILHACMWRMVQRRAYKTAA